MNKGKGVDKRKDNCAFRRGLVVKREELYSTSFFELFEIKIKIDTIRKCFVRSSRDFHLRADFSFKNYIPRDIFVMRFLRKINAVKEQCRCGKRRNFAEIIIKESGFFFRIKSE